MGRRVDASVVATPLPLMVDVELLGVCRDGLGGLYSCGMYSTCTDKVEGWQRHVGQRRRSCCFDINTVGILIQNYK